MVMDLETTRTQVRLDTPSSTGTEITGKPFLHTRLKDLKGTSILTLISLGAIRLIFAENGLS